MFQFVAFHIAKHALLYGVLAPFAVNKTCVYIAFCIL